jgi:hypothetical protein
MQEPNQKYLFVAATATYILTKVPRNTTFQPVLRIRDVLSRIREFFHSVSRILCHVKKGVSKSKHTFFLLLTVSGLSFKSSPVS